MVTSAVKPERGAVPHYVHHPSLDEEDAAQRYDPAGAADDPSFLERHMPDDVTRDTARRMHYAAHRMHAATTAVGAHRWQQIYFGLRDRVVLGNRKLIYRAVRRRPSDASRADDLIGDCHIVLIQAVAAFNPWLGIRFSTYAYTCLVRALARIGRRLSNDRLSCSLPLDVLPDGEPRGPYEHEPVSSRSFQLEEFLRDDHPLLTPREKSILKLRFGLSGGPPGPTLERVGKQVGLSKERVRQVQALALGKLRQALTTGATAS